MSESIFQGDFVEATRVGAVATVRFGREEQRNALSAAMLHEFEQATRLLRMDSSISVVVLTGGQRCFSAGADLKAPELFGRQDALEHRLGLLSRSEIARSWAELPQVTIAAIEGYAVGGGLSIALCCDFRVIAQDAFVCVPEIDMGSIYVWNSVPRLTALVGPSLTRRLILLAERISAEQALEWRLVDFIAPKGEATARAAEIANQLAAKPRLALQINKRSINAFQSAMAHLVGHGDSDQAVLCRLAREDDARRRSGSDAADP